MDVEIDYEQNPDKAMQVILDTARELWNERPGEITEEPSMLGIDKLSNAAITLRLMVKTTPTMQFEIARELRRRIKLAFDREGIKTPSARQQLVITRKES